MWNVWASRQNLASLCNSKRVLGPGAVEGPQRYICHLYAAEEKECHGNRPDVTALSFMSAQQASSSSASSAHPTSSPERSTRAKTKKAPDSSRCSIRYQHSNLHHHKEAPAPHEVEEGIDVAAAAARFVVVAVQASIVKARNHDPQQATGLAALAGCQIGANDACSCGSFRGCRCRGLLGFWRWPRRLFGYCYAGSECRFRCSVCRGRFRRRPVLEVRSLAKDMVFGVDCNLRVNLALRLLDCRTCFWARVVEASALLLDLTDWDS